MIKKDKKNLNLWKIKVLCITLCLGLLFAHLPAQAFSYIEQQTSEISIEYDFKNPIIIEEKINGKIYDKIIINDIPSIGNPGEPNLPTAGAYILLPYHTKVNNLQVYYDEKICLGAGYNVIPAATPIPINCNPKEINSISENKKIYSTNKEFPGPLFTMLDTFSFRGYDILVLMLHPVQYIPTSGEIYFFSKLSISIDIISDHSRNQLFQGNLKDKEEVIKKINNPQVADTYPHRTYQTYDSYDLLIITTDELQSSFQPLKQHHDDHGLNTTIKTLTEIGSSNPDDIRDFIRDEYNNSEIEYVLIGGDHDIVPSKIMFVSGWDEDTTYYERELPADFYYGCLDGPFNYDGDDKWGEYGDGEDGGDVDLFAEVYVGRASVQNTTEVGYFITKTLGYLNLEGDENYLRKLCLVGAYMGEHGIATYGGNYSDQLIDNCSADGYNTTGFSSSNYSISTIYDRDYPGYWPKELIIEAINQGRHSINHLGHSTYCYNMRITFDDVLNLTNENYCFIYSQGCTSGAFDDPYPQLREDCIAEYYTIKTPHAAFAGIWNARFGFFWSNSTDGDSQRYHREFWDAILGENITQLGKANQDSKEDNLFMINRSCMRWAYYGLNLFGDPTISFHTQQGSWPPPFTCGDANNDGSIDIDDVVYLIAYIFSGGPEPEPLICTGDANGDSSVDIDDVVYLISYIFAGGPEPVEGCCV